MSLVLMVPHEEHVRPQRALSCIVISTESKSTNALIPEVKGHLAADSADTHEEEELRQNRWNQRKQHPEEPGTQRNQELEPRGTRTQRNHWNQD
ncbi:hypothetical protein NQZ68_035431 [Dissostichus eleginoides]|uniref:Acetyltransferase n=1 Tax=Dissostichus eleginoides TaxID=100907 RepID=A0AAD9ESY0_DISEL|nr:hypothetical protein NQZ68_035431 [Dissostichus eleginoides]KAK1875886.1 Acetyltransferase [Dissostichus eleginoides]KAK1875905.1 Acetyltransferase [Dissostichus eleginoides]